MIKFFRNIRQNLLSEGQTGKYLKYAIGETILVVFGILIALQINNWNEATIQTKKTRNYLEAFKIELENNVSRIDQIIQRTRKDLKTTLKVLTDLNDETKNIDNDYMYHTGLLPVFKVEMKASVLADMINSGVLDNLPNDELKGRIFTIKTVYENYDENHNNAKNTWDSYLLPYLNEHMNVTNLWDSLSVVKMPKLKFKNNLEAFVNNKYFANILSSRMRMLANIDLDINRTNKMMLELISELDNHLAND